MEYRELILNRLHEMAIETYVENEDKVNEIICFSGGYLRLYQQTIFIYDYTLVNFSYNSVIEACQKCYQLANNLA